MSKIIKNNTSCLRAINAKITKFVINYKLKDVASTYFGWLPAEIMAIIVKIAIINSNCCFKIGRFATIDFDIVYYERYLRKCLEYKQISMLYGNISECNLIYSGMYESIADKIVKKLYSCDNFEMIFSHIYKFLKDNKDIYKMVILGVMNFIFDSSLRWFLPIQSNVEILLMLRQIKRYIVQYLPHISYNDVSNFGSNHLHNIESISIGFEISIYIDVHSIDCGSSKMHFDIHN